MKISHRQMSAIPVIGLAVAAFSPFASITPFSTPANHDTLATAAVIQNRCEVEAAESNPRPFLFIGCGIE